MYKDQYLDVNNLSDEQVDELYAFRKTNTLKSAAPLCIYFVLRDHSDSHRHLTQQEILDYVEDRYDVKLERKALSRWLHLLMMLDVGIISDPRYGSWMES